MEPYYQHKENLKSSQVISDVAIGMSDGLIVPFVLVAGLSGMVSSTGIIVMAGMAEVVICSVAMALGGYQAGKTEMQTFYDEEEKKVAGNEKEAQNIKKNVKEFYAHLGLPGELQEQATREVIRDKEIWADIVHREPAWKTDGSKKAGKTALNIGLSYFAGGVVPLTPYFFMESPLKALKYSVVLTLVCLFALGWLQGKASGSSGWAGAIRLTLLGAIAAGCAFFVTRLIN